MLVVVEKKELIKLVVRERLKVSQSVVKEVMVLVEEEAVAEVVPLLLVLLLQWSLELLVAVAEVLVDPILKVMI